MRLANIPILPSNYLTRTAIFLTYQVDIDDLIIGVEGPVRAFACPDPSQVQVKAEVLQVSHGPIGGYPPVVLEGELHGGCPT